MATKRRLIVTEDFDLGYGTTTIPTDTGGLRAASKVGIHTIYGGYVLSAADFQGDDFTAKVTAAHAALPSTGGVIDCRGLAATQTMSSSITITKPCLIVMGIVSVTCPLRASAFKFWSGTTVYSNIAVVGAGRGLTVFTVPTGATPGTTSGYFNNVFELINPLDTTGTHVPSNIHIAHLTCDGNKSNVTIPAAAASDDVYHNAVMSQACTKSSFEDLELKNFWFQGLGFGLYSTYIQMTDILTVNNGYSSAVGYGGISIQGSSFHNTVTGHISVGDIIGVWMISNARHNTITGTYINCVHGIVHTENSGNAGYGNVVNATILNSSLQGLSISTDGVGTMYGDIYNVTIKDSTDSGAIVSGSTLVGCTFNLNISHGQGIAIDLRASNNFFNVCLLNNSQAVANSNYAIECTSASSNFISGVIADTQVSTTQRGMKFDSGSGNNDCNVTLFGATSSVSDSGTQNKIVANGVNRTPQSLAPFNYIATETGADTAIVGSIGGTIPPNQQAGLQVTILLAHSLQAAGSNTFNYNSNGTAAIKSHRNHANDIATAYVSGAIVTLMYDGSVWLDMSQ